MPRLARLLPLVLLVPACQSETDARAAAFAGWDADAHAVAAGTLPLADATDRRMTFFATRPFELGVVQKVQPGGSARESVARAVATCAVVRAGADRERAAARVRAEFAAMFPGAAELVLE